MMDNMNSFILYMYIPEPSAQTLSWSFEEQRAHLLRIMRIMYLLSIVKAVMHSSII
jgi:hypothetical protein